MRRIALRITVSIITFAIGISFTFSVVDVFRNFSNTELEESNHHILPEQEKIDLETVKVSPTGKVEIKFIGWGSEENRPTLKFEIINHNSKPAVYWSQTEKGVWMFVKFNGKEKQEWRCGTGNQKFTLNPGESFTIAQLADFQTHEFLKQKGSFQFGYYFGFGENDQRMIWSEPISFSEEMKKEIIRNAPDFMR